MNTAVVDVGATNFLTASSASKEALKTATLLKTLNVNSIIRGDEGVGKKTLANFILDDAFVISASDFNEKDIQKNNKIILTDLQKTSDLKHIFKILKHYSLKVVATASSEFEHEVANSFFGINIHLPPLVNRMEDVDFLMEKFTKEIQALFGYNFTLNIQKEELDLSKNAISLRRDMFKRYILHNLNDVDLINLMEVYLQDKIGSKNDYKDFLYLYEAPLIKAGLKKFGSQLQLAEKLGLNRNTLRKKISQNKEYIKNV